jgi:uncharacterized protein
MNTFNPQNDPELSAFFDKLANSVDFQGIKLINLNERSIFGDTPLNFAVIEGNKKIGKILLEAGADPNIQGECGYTPLHNAVSKKDYDFAKLLLAHGASKKLTDEDGFTVEDLVSRSNDSQLKDIFSNFRS